MQVSPGTRRGQASNAKRNKESVGGKSCNTICEAHLFRIGPRESRRRDQGEGARESSKTRTGDLLANEENIDRTEVEVIEEWKCSETVIRRMLAGIKLDTNQVNT